MSEDIGSGFSNATKGAVGGVILSFLLGVIPRLPFVPSVYGDILKLIEVVNLVGSIVLISSFESWGVGYLIGWLSGTGIMSSVGLVESWLFTIYAVVGVVVLIVKGLQWIEKSQKSK